MAGSLETTGETFSTVTAEHPLLVVGFWAPWCAPCRALAPLIETLATAYDGRVTFAKIDVDENQATAERFGVRSIPALLFFRDGVQVDRTAGALPESILRMKVDQLIGPRAPAVATP